MEEEAADREGSFERSRRLSARCRRRGQAEERTVGADGESPVTGANWSPISTCHFGLAMHNTFAHMRAKSHAPPFAGKIPWAPRGSRETRHGCHP